MQNQNSKVKKYPPVIKRGKLSLKFNPKMRIFVILLGKNIRKLLAGYFTQIQNYSQFINKKFNRLAIISEKTIWMCLKKSFEKCKMEGNKYKKSERLFKNVVILFNRLHFNYKYFAFQRLYLRGKVTKTLKPYKGLLNHREILFQNKLNRFIKSKILSYFVRIVQFQSNGNKRAFSIICRKIVQVNLYSAFFLIYSHSYLNYKKNSNLVRERQSNNDNLKDKLHNIAIELEYKNRNIQKITNDINRYKNQLQQNSQAYEHCFENNRDKSEQNQRSKSNSFNQKQNKKAKILIHQKSFMSLLSNSFNSFYSKNSRQSSSKFRINKDSMNGQDCHCLFRFKYQEYKSLYETEKNQLEILKKQLQVAKDLNEHFENQMKFYGGKTNEDEEELEKLKLNLGDIYKDVQFLKNKVTKYQNHVTNLKEDFKNKLSDIYRKYRKEGAQI